MPMPLISRSIAKLIVPEHINILFSHRPLSPQILLFSGDEPQLIPTPKPKFSSPIWIEEIHRNKIFNKQKSVCNDDLIPHADDDHDQATMPLTNGAIFLTEPPAYGNGGDVTPRRTRVRFPVRSISEILEFEDEEEVVIKAAPDVVPTSATAAVEQTNGEVGFSTAAAEKSPSTGSRNGLRFLQTDI
jgi:hypothetical protein